MCIANENPFANYNLYRLDPPDSWPMDGCLETTSSPLVSSSPVDSGPIIIPQINQVALNKSNFNPSTVLFDGLYGACLKNWVSPVIIHCGISLINHPAIGVPPWPWKPPYYPPQPRLRLHPEEARAVRAHHDGRQQVVGCSQIQRQDGAFGLYQTHPDRGRDKVQGVARCG